MCFLKLPPKQTILLLFTRVDKPWYVRHLKGFNHVAIGWVVDDEWVWLVDPLTVGAVGDYRGLEELKHPNVCILELTILNNHENKLIRPLFQTCATIVQYLGGFNLRATLVQTLFDRLTLSGKQYLASHGIRRVKVWEQSQSVPS